MNRREEIRKQEEITRLLASFGYQPSFHNLKQVRRRVNAEVFAQNPYQAVRDALLDAQRFKELEEPEPKTRTVAPVQTPATPRQPDITRQTEIVESVLNRYPRYRGVDSNVAMILTSLEGAPFSASSVEQAIARCIQQRKLGTNSEYADALKGFFTAHPEYSGVAANEQLLVAAADEHFGVITAESLEDALRDDVIGVREKLCMNPQAAKAAADSAERQQIIDGLLSAKTAITASGSRVITNEAGQNESVERFSARLSAMTLDELRLIRDTRSRARDFRAMTKEQLREVVRGENPAPPQFLPLPPEGFKVPGKNIYLPWTKGTLRALPGSLFKQLLEKHGDEVIMGIYNQK